jgi:hypothetical protein
VPEQRLLQDVLGTAGVAGEDIAEAQQRIAPRQHELVKADHVLTSHPVHESIMSIRYREGCEVQQGATRVRRPLPGGGG